VVDSEAVERVSSGVRAVDDLLGGLIPGDNIVWVSSDGHLIGSLESGFLQEGVAAGVGCWYVAVDQTPKDAARRLPAGVRVLDARPDRKHADPVTLERILVEEAGSHGARVALGRLDVLARQWGSRRALEFFSHVCPRLFDLGAIAYWWAPRSLGAPFIGEVRRVTQCVVEERRSQLRVVKAEGRPSTLQGKLFHLDTSADGDITLRAEVALGRLGQGLARLREERHLSQAELARLAGVSPSAISQAEAGLRGLSVDTLLVLSEQLGVGIDHILENDTDAGYVLARRNRTAQQAAQVPLLDDPQAGMRAFLVNLGPSERGAPPSVHKGVEAVLVAAGLVQLDLGVETPVMRAGDALLATKVAVAGWRNLLQEPARLFWIIRD
jgi:transcriptional regulator with XRE-family HTH domain